MSESVDLEDTVERLIEMVIMRDQIGFSDDLSLDNLTRMAMLDVDALDSEGASAGFFSSPDWSSALQAIESDAAMQKRIDALLEGSMNGDHAAVVWSKSIERIMEEEFEASNDIEENEWQEGNLVQKVRSSTIYKLSRMVTDRFIV